VSRHRSECYSFPTRRSSDLKIQLDDPDHANTVMTLDELKTVLTNAQSEAQSSDKQLSVLINGSESRPYGEVMQLMSTLQDAGLRSEEHTSELQSRENLVCRL